MQVISGQSFYEQIMNKIETLCKRYPFLRRENTGWSACGRQLPVIRLGGEDAVFFLAGVHAMEYITVLLLLKWLEQLCRAWDSSDSIFGFYPAQAFMKKGLILMPCMNPDGVELAFGGLERFEPDLQRKIIGIAGQDLSQWNANINGVDLNHNFDAGWETLRHLEEEVGIFGPSPRRYGGPCPESEPETQAVTRLCRKYRFRQALAFHTQGEEIYWQYENTPRCSEIMAQILSLSCGYQLASPEEIASHGGFKDWFIREFSRPAFTIEFGKGKNPLPLEQLDPIFHRTAEMLFIAALM